MNETALVPHVVKDSLTVSDMKAKIDLVKSYMSEILMKADPDKGIDGHYGTIPGCGNKPALFKSGAEMLLFGFNYRAEFDIDEVDLGNGHREVKVKTTIYSKNTGMEVGQGVGSASTMESKWKYRSGVFEPTDFDVPKEYWKNRDNKVLEEIDSSLKGMPLGTKKDESGNWKIAIKGEKAEHPNPADNYNTVLKMAKKRSYVDATITATACSDIFTQDIEEGMGDPDSKGKNKKESKEQKPKQQKQKDTDLISKDQLQRISNLAEKNGWTPDDLKNYVAENFKKERGSEMTVNEGNQLLQAIEPDDIPT